MKRPAPPTNTNPTRKRGRRVPLWGEMILACASGWCAVLLAMVLAGCTQRTATTADATHAPASVQDESNTARDLALDSLRKLAEGSDPDPRQPIQRTAFYLNQWLKLYAPASAPWTEDRLLTTLHPALLERTPGMKGLHVLQFALKADDTFFLPDDIDYLQQTLWLHDIASRIRREPPPADLQPWLKEIEAAAGLPEAEQLAAAERLFDWTIRNVQLDPLPPTPKALEATVGSTSEAIDPAELGEIGPGYGHLPLQLLLFGHGDAHERARIFILLCRQAGIDAVMLGFEERASPEPRAWNPAVLVGGQLYLFETSLGVPIPGPAGKGIATLSQVSADPALLRQLDVEGFPEYPVTGDDLRRVIALIDAEPAALSRRMQLLQGALLQAALPGNFRLALSVQPSVLETKLRGVRSLRPEKVCSLWRVPLQAILYQAGYFQRVLPRDQQAAQEFALRNIVFRPDRPLTKARNLHLQGRFENKENQPGARSLYLACRRSDREIRALKTNEYYRKSQGLEQFLPSDPAQQEAALDFLIEVAFSEKFHATYWLGLTYYDEGKYAAAVEWLGQRTMQADQPSPWTPGARYNLARCFEQLGNYDLARQWLESDKDSPQRQGNLLRAKRLAQRSASVAATAESAP